MDIFGLRNPDGIVLDMFVDGRTRVLLCPRGTKAVKNDPEKEFRSRNIYHWGELNPFLGVKGHPPLPLPAGLRVERRKNVTDTVVGTTGEAPRVKFTSQQELASIDTPLTQIVIPAEFGMDTAEVLRTQHQTRCVVVLMGEKHPCTIFTYMSRPTPVAWWLPVSENMP